MIRAIFFIFVIHSLIGCMNNPDYLRYKSIYSKNGSLVTDNLYIDSVTYNLISGDLLIPHENCTSERYFCLRGDLINIMIPKCKDLTKGETWIINELTYIIKDTFKVNNELTYFINVIDESGLNQLDSFTYSYHSGVKKMKIRYGEESLTYSIKGAGLFIREQCQ